MPDTLIFYHNPRSRASMVHWMLEEVGAEYEVRLISFAKSENKTPEFLAINPMGKLPTLVAGDTVLTETPAIIAWLADAYPDKGLAPKVGSADRGTWYRWLFFGGSCIEPALVDEMFKRPAPDVPGALGWGSYDDVIDTLEKEALVPGPFLLGDHFTAADVYIAAELYWGMAFGARRLKESQVITDYVGRCAEREAFKRTVATDLG